MEARPAAESSSELIRWMSIQDANSAGFIHGGVVMRMSDEAAGIALSALSAWPAYFLT